MLVTTENTVCVFCRHYILFTLADIYTSYPGDCNKINTTCFSRNLIIYTSFLYFLKYLSFQFQCQLILHCMTLKYLILCLLRHWQTQIYHSQEFYVKIVANDMVAHLLRYIENNALKNRKMLTSNPHYPLRKFHANHRHQWL